MRNAIGLVALSVLAACADETLSGYADPGATYTIVEINGVASPPNATIAFPGRNKVVGRTPCNRWEADLTVPYPWFGLGPITATGEDCEDTGVGPDFLAMLAAMTLAEVTGPVLILSDDTGSEIVFRAR